MIKKPKKTAMSTEALRGTRHAMQTYDEGREDKKLGELPVREDENLTAKIERSNNQRGNSHICQHRAAAMR